jgi:hypothetical protein
MNGSVVCARCDSEGTHGHLTVNAVSNSSFSWSIFKRSDSLGGRITPRSLDCSVVSQSSRSSPSMFILRWYLHWRQRKFRAQVLDPFTELSAGIRSSRINGGLTAQAVSARLLLERRNETASASRGARCSPGPKQTTAREMRCQTAEAMPTHVNAMLDLHLNCRGRANREQLRTCCQWIREQHVWLRLLPFTQALSVRVDPEGLEPPTPWFEAKCSIQLSYGSAKSFAEAAPTRETKV